MLAEGQQWVGSPRDGSGNGLKFGCGGAISPDGIRAKYGVTAFKIAAVVNVIAYATAP